MMAAVHYTMLLLLLLLQLQLPYTQAFVPPQAAFFQSRIIARPTTTSNPHQHATAAAKTTTTTTTQRMLMPMDISEMVTSVAASASSAAWSSSMWISTVDSDIANIPQNEFASVFTGGLIVMSGGLLSALIVGFILESRNLYASVVVDSYIDNTDALEDEEFWKSLSEEEQKKTRQVLDKIKQQKQGLGGDSKVAVVVDAPPTKTMTSVITTTTTEETTTTTPAAVAKEDGAKGSSKKIDMFSDYGD